MIKDKDKTRPSEDTKMEKRKKRVIKESEPTYQFKGQSVRSQHWFNLDPDWIEDKFMTREPDFSKAYTLNVFQAEKIRIGYIFCSNWLCKKKQFKFNLIQTPLSWPTSDTTKTVVDSVV